MEMGIVREIPEIKLTTEEKISIYYEIRDEQMRLTMEKYLERIKDETDAVSVAKHDWLKGQLKNLTASLTDRMDLLELWDRECKIAVDAEIRSLFELATAINLMQD